LTASSRRTQIVTTRDALDAVVEELSRERVIGVDTEANSFFVYRERTCLVQVSSGDADFILDPQAVDLAPFMELLAEPRVEKIFHASEFDVLSLKRDYGVAIRNLFDTSIAAKAVGRKKLGLAGLVEEILGVALVKDEQRSDWGRRPLSPQQVQYAYADTRHLIDIAQVLKREVEAAGLAEEVAVDCERVLAKEPRPREYDPESFERHSRARKLDPASRRVLRQLYLAREERAAGIDKPPFRVVGDDVLAEMAARKATTREQLRGIVGLTPPVLARHGDLLLETVRAALAMEPLPMPRRAPGAFDPAEEERYEKLREWRRKLAEARKVEVEVIAGNAVLRAIAKVRPGSIDDLAVVPELDAYRRARYGEQLVAVLSARG
jgi:ribonuclease D